MNSILLRGSAFAVSVNIILASSCGQAADPGQPGESGEAKSPSALVKPLRVADFELGRLVTLSDTPWVVFTDAEMSGKSVLTASAGSPGGQASRHSMVLTGRLTTDLQWGGFAGITAQLVKSGASTNLSRFTGLQFLARGDGKAYRAALGKENVTDNNHFYAEFTAKSDWSLIQLPFAKFSQSPYFGTRVTWSAENLTAVCFMATAEAGHPAAVKLEIDNVSFY